MCVSLVARTFSAPLAEFSTTKSIATPSRLVAIENARTAQYNAHADRFAAQSRFLVEKPLRSSQGKSSRKTHAGKFSAASSHQALRAHRADVRVAPPPRRRALRSENQISRESRRRR
jgi:hypothetical protein